MAMTREQRKMSLKLVAALFSGQYPKGIGSLRSQTDGGELRYCCQGVGCEISGKGEWTSPDSNTFDLKGSLKSAPNRTYVSGYWGPLGGDVYGIGDLDSGSLAHMNDGRVGVTPFAERPGYYSGYNQEPATQDEIAMAILFLIEDSDDELDEFAKKSLRGK